MRVQTLINDLERANPLFKQFWPEEMKDQDGMATFRGAVWPNSWRGGIYAKCGADKPVWLKALFGNQSDARCCQQTLLLLGISSAIRSDGNAWFEIEFSSDDVEPISTINGSFSRDYTPACA